MINEAIEQLDQARKRLGEVKKENEQLRDRANRAEQSVEELTHQVQSLMTQRDNFQSSNNEAIRQRDAARAEVERLIHWMNEGW